MGGYTISRERMVREQLLPRGITDNLVLAAVRKTPRHLFVPEALIPRAYDDHPLPIGHGQTISQPFVVAWMSQLLEASAGMRVLEVGTGSGYQAAVLNDMGLEVYTTERLRELYVSASTRFMQLRYNKIKMRLSDGTLGWPEEAPFDRIIVTAGGPVVPEPLVDQLADPGILVLPVGTDRGSQKMLVVYKSAGQISYHEQGGVAFVDLVGNYGWNN